MFDYGTVTDKWILLTLFAGTATVLYVALYYYDLWATRKMREDDPQEYKTGYLSVWDGIPVSVKVTITVISFFTVTYIVYLLFNPTNW